MTSSEEGSRVATAAAYKGKQVMVADEEKSDLVYFSVLLNNEYIDFYHPPEYDWYVLDTNHSVPTKLPPCSNLPWLFGSAVFVSNLYVLGGQITQIIRPGPRKYHLTNQVHIFNTTTREWALSDTSMNGVRACPLSIPMPDKLYVFGGDARKEDQGHLLYCGTPWAEFYCIKSHEWVPLPVPPVEITTCSKNLTGHAVCGAGSRILLWNQLIFCLFDTDKQEWLALIDAPYRYDPRDVRAMYSTRVAVIDETMYWFFGDIFAYNLAENKGCERPVYSFDSGPPFATFLFERDSPYVIATSKEEFCVVWYEHLTPEKGDGYKDRLRVDCLEFQVKRSTDGENGLLVNPVCKGQSAFTIEGCYFYQIANMQWKNGDKGRHDFSTDSSQTPVVGPVDLLNNLSCMMQDLNYYSYWRHDDQWSFDVPAAGIVRLEVPNLKVEELSLERFLDSLGLGNYLQTFQGKKVDMEALKNTDVNKLKDLKIPLGDRKMLLLGLRQLISKEAARVSEFPWNRGELKNRRSYCRSST